MHASDPRRLIAAFPDPVVVVSTEGRIVATNAAADRAIGRTLAAGDRLADVAIGGEGLDDYLRAWACSTVPIPGALRLTADDGGERRFRADGARAVGGWIFLRLTPSGQPNPFIALRQQVDALNAEVARRRAIQEELEASRALLRRAVESLARLQAVTAALSATQTIDEAGEIVVSSAIQAVGASGGAMFVVDDRRETIETVRHVGYAAHLIERFAVPLPLDAPTPAAEAIRTRRPVLLESQDELATRFPEVAAHAESRRVHAAIPIVADGRALGALGFSFDGPRTFDAGEIDLLQALASQCANAVQRAQVIRRARRLQELTAQLADVLAPTAIGEIAVDQAAAALGARTGALWLVADDGRHLELHRAHGDPGDGAAWGRIPLDGDAPVAAAARTGEPVLLESMQAYATRFATSAARIADHRVEPDAAIACVPVRAGGRVGGTLCFAFAGPRPFHDDERALLSVLAQHTAQALVRTRLFQAEQAARAAAEAEQRRDRFLADATAALASALDPDRTLRDVARLAVPTFADLAAVLLRGPGGELDKIVVHHDPSREALVHELYARFPPPPDAATGVAYVLRTGEPELYPEITDAMKARSVPDPDQRRLIDAIGLCSMIAVPMRIGGQVIGALTFWHGASGRRFDRADLDVARALADRAALAIEHTRAVRALEHAVRAREDLLAIVSHDLRNPLGVVMLKTQVLLDQLPADAEKPRRHVQQLHQAAQRMEALVRDLMDLAAIDAGLLRVDLRPEDVGELLAQVIDLHAPLAAKAGLTLAAAPPPEPHVVLCDRERVLQVFSNLIGNAIKHTPAGGTIRMTARADRHRVWFAVRDTGPGIAPEHLNDAFRRHWKGEARDRSSLGLGLYIAKGLVDALGGEIGVDSTLGVGTTFRFSLRSALPE